MKRTLTWLIVLVGILCLGVAVFYWMTPAQSLPAWMPGYAAGDTATHLKHGIAALVVGLLLLVWAWFRSAPKVS